MMPLFLWVCLHTKSKAHSIKYDEWNQNPQVEDYLTIAIKMKYNTAPIHRKEQINPKWDVFCFREKINKITF